MNTYIVTYDNGTGFEDPIPRRIQVNVSNEEEAWIKAERALDNVRNARIKKIERIK